MAHVTPRRDAYAESITAPSVELSVTRSRVRFRLTNRGRPMEFFIHEQNLAHYRKVLSETTDPVKRQMVLRLLVDEQKTVPPRIDWKQD